MRAGNTEVGLARVTAAPLGTPAEVDAAVAKSYTGQRWSNIKAMLQGKVRLYPRAHRVQMVDAIAALLTKLHVGSSVVEERDGGAFLTMGNATGGFVFHERDVLVHDVSRMGNADLRTAGLVAVNAASETALRSQSLGRGTQARVGDARGAALRAATGNAAFVSRPSAITLVKRVCGSRRPPEFDALRTAVLSGEQLLQVAESLNPTFVGALSRIEEELDFGRNTGPSVVRDKITGNQSLRAALLESWATLYRADFSGDCPNFAYIYAILLTMTALQWRNECHRVLVIGERVSLVFGGDLPIGYRVMLARMLPLAEAAGDTEWLTGTYIGQENRGATSKSKCDRWQQHMTKQGCLNIAQIKFVTNRRGGFVCTPLGPVVMESRFVAMQPAGDANASRVNGAEALIFAACERVPGFVGMNDSPPGEDARLLVGTWAGPPRIFQLCGGLVDSLGGEEKAAKSKLCDAAVTASAGPFVRNVLEAVHLLIENKLYVDKDGQPLKHDFKGGSRSRFAKFSVQTLVTAVFGSIDVDGGTVSPQLEYTLALWCDACSCRYIGPLCKHLLSGRIVSLIRKVAPFWHGNAETLYWGAGPLPSYAVRCCSTAAEVADTLQDDTEADAAAAEDLPALYAAAGHHLALIAERASTGDFDAGTLASVATALRSLVKRAEGWSGARITEPGGASRRGGILGAYKRRVGSTEEVDTDRAGAPQLRDPLSQSARLEILVKTHPLPKYDVSHGVGDSLTSSAQAAIDHATSAVVALGAAAPRAATAMRTAAKTATAVASAAPAGFAALEAAEGLTALLTLGGRETGGAVPAVDPVKPQAVQEDHHLSRGDSGPDTGQDSPQCHAICHFHNA